MSTKILKYNHKNIEKKWQDKWDKDKLYVPDIKKAQNAFFNLWMFPYPSAEGLHAGHAFASTGSDVQGRFQRMNGKIVFQPIGYDSFGIHSENYALKISEDPHEVVARTSKNYERQMRALGHGYDWTRTVTTSSLEYYQWTEWIFIALFKAGLAYKKSAKVNFCLSCKTVLADEQVMTPKQAGKDPKNANGEVIGDKTTWENLKVCERCATVVETRELSQWFFRITDYAEKLLENLVKIDWSQRVKTAQNNWIGKSKGLTIDFKVQGLAENLSVWTKYWETTYGVTFIVVSPEYAEKNLKGLITQKYAKKVFAYIEKSIKKSEQERSEIKIKSGVETGIYANNPVNGEKVPIFVADYVLAGVGTGAVMGVPAHDERDFEFAKKYALQIRQVVSYKDNKLNEMVATQQIAHEGYLGGEVLVNSGNFDNLNVVSVGKEKMARWMIQESFARWETNYHLRDWLISRQRYWGCPIPMIYCQTCAKAGRSWFTENKEQKLIHTNQNDWDSAGWHPEKYLPVELPRIKDWKPEGTGKGPLANHPDYYQVKCPNCGADAERETDVADTFLDSSWYFLRYPSVDAKSATSLPFDVVITKKWLPVDLYFGGAEHSVLHLMYARFVTMVLKDLNHVDFEEPFPKFFAHGLMIKDGAKMSKSRGNVVNPDEYVEKFGADTLRLYLMFMGPMDGYPDFRDDGIEGMGRFVQKLWFIFKSIAKDQPNDSLITSKMHQTIKKVTNDLATFNYNTAISAIMEYINLLQAKKNYSGVYLETLVKLIAPFAPHLAEEVWSQIFGKKGTIHEANWPKFDEKYLVSDRVQIVVQVNGKVRSQIEISVSSANDNDDVINIAKSDSKVQAWLQGKELKNTIYVPNRLVNFVV